MDNHADGLHTRIQSNHVMVVGDMDLAIQKASVYAGILLDYEESKDEVNTPEMEDYDDEH